MLAWIKTVQAVRQAGLWKPLLTMMFWSPASRAKFGGFAQQFIKDRGFGIGVGHGRGAQA